MRPIALLIPLAGLAIWCAPAWASQQLLFSVEGLDGIDVATRDGDGTARPVDVDEDNGLFSFPLDPPAADIEPVAIHVSSGVNRSSYVYIWIVRTPSGLDPDPPFPWTYPFFITDTEERVITEFLVPPDVRFTLGEEVSVTDGLIEGFDDAVVYLSPGTDSALEVLDVDLTTLDLYTGPLTIEGRITVVPEPGTATLVLLGALALSALRPRRRRQV